MNLARKVFYGDAWRMSCVRMETFTNPKVLIRALQTMDCKIKNSWQVKIQQRRPSEPMLLERKSVRHTSLGDAN